MSKLELYNKINSIKLKKDLGNNEETIIYLKDILKEINLLKIQSDKFKRQDKPFYICYKRLLKEINSILLKLNINL